MNEKIDLVGEKIRREKKDMKNSGRNRNGKKWTSR